MPNILAEPSVVAETFGQADPDGPILARRAECQRRHNLRITGSIGSCDPWQHSRTIDEIMMLKLTQLTFALLILSSMTSAQDTNFEPEQQQIPVPELSGA